MTRLNLFNAAVHHAALFNADARFTLKPATDGSQSPGTLTGYAMVYGAISTDRGGYRARFMPGSASFSGGGVRALFNHASDHGPLGRTKNGTLRVFADNVGVAFELDLANTTMGRDVAELVRRKDIEGMSFGVQNWPPPGTEVSENVGGKAVTIFNITQAVLDEITVTDNPAFLESSVGHKPEAADAAAKQHSARVVAADSARFERLRFGSIFLPAR